MIADFTSIVQAAETKTIWLEVLTLLREVVGELSLDGEGDWRVSTAQCGVTIVVQELIF